MEVHSIMQIFNPLFLYRWWRSSKLTAVSNYVTVLRANSASLRPERDLHDLPHQRVFGQFCDSVEILQLRFFCLEKKWLNIKDFAATRPGARHCIVHSS